MTNSFIESDTGYSCVVAGSIRCCALGDTYCPTRRGKFSYIYGYSWWCKHEIMCHWNYV